MEKALGARRSHILLLQFLAESLTITFIGGALGVILAYGVSLSVGRLTLYSAMAKNAEAGDMRLVIAPGTLIVATLILAAEFRKFWTIGESWLAIPSVRYLESDHVRLCLVHTSQK